MVSYFKINYKVHRNKRQSISERSDSIRSEQTDQKMIKAIIVEQIRDAASRLEQTELRGIIRLDQIGVRANGEKTRQIGAEQEHHGEKEGPCQNIT